MASIVGSSRKRFFVGCNWKGGLTSATAVDDLVDRINLAWDHAALSDLELCLFPPYVFLDRVRQKLDPRMQVGSQNVGEALGPLAATTGTVGAEMVASIGCCWVLLGHADRRHALGETDELLAAKVGACLKAGLNVNLTLGDTRAIREAGNADTELLRQLSEASAEIPSFAWGRMVLAYEPVWAVGAGAEPCSPVEAQRVLALLRGWISEKVGSEAATACRMVYTGSVNEENAAAYAALPDNDGFVVGRAGLDAGKLVKVCSALLQL
eukprot:TRINITY_DN43852_c0_g1_i1.p1 TRINITY_DN43852_c0_g1~~TRINITY_DN43852_c0_g1_i1.p1  ORF type:complete len:267 (-),score=52.98 TRINITY_DN43852_c0_g1_i1:360-1160(-)